MTYDWIVFCVLCLNYIISGTAYPWQVNHEGYDASLDPVIWSRAFVKDNIRRTRQFSALHPSTGENSEINLLNRFNDFRQRFIDSNRAASDILRDERKRVEENFDRRRSDALQVGNYWSAERRSNNKRKSSLNRSKLQQRRKRNHIR